MAMETDDRPMGALAHAYQSRRLRRSAPVEDPFLAAAVARAAAPLSAKRISSSSSSNHERRRAPAVQVSVEPSDNAAPLSSAAIDRLLAKLDLLLGTRSTSAPLQQCSDVDLNGMYQDAQDVVLDFDVCMISLLGRAEWTELMGRLRERIEMWMDRRAAHEVRMFERLVMRSGDGLPTSQWSLQCLGGLQEYLSHYAGETEKTVQMAKVIQQVLNPLTHSSRFAKQADWAFQSVAEHHQSKDSNLKATFVNSFLMLSKYTLCCPVIEAPLLYYSYPGVLNVRWNQAQLPSFLQSYLRVRAVFQYLPGWTSHGSIIPLFVVQVIDYLSTVAPRILARCKLETSPLVQGASAKGNIPPAQEEGSDSKMDLDPDSRQVHGEPVQGPLESIPQSMNRFNAAALYANWAQGVIEFMLNFALVILGNDKEGVREMMGAVVDEVVDKQYDQLSQSFGALLDSSSWYDLGVLYRLASKRLEVPIRLNPEDKLVIMPSSGTFTLFGPMRYEHDPQGTFLRVFREFVENKTCTLVRDGKDQDMIPDLLRLWNELSDAARKTFSDQVDLFLSALRDGFAAGIAKRDNKPAEMLAKHLDALLRTGNRAMTDAELEHALDDSLLLFRFIKDKDMFEEFYTRHFAKRLLLNKSASSDAEASMLLKLKITCGSEFTQRLETMLKDITMSEDMMVSWETYAAKAAASDPSNHLDFDVSVNVLTQAHWPTYPHHQGIRLPDDMARAARLFEEFYASRHQGRQLAWLHNLGNNVLLAHLPNKREPCELVVSTYQAMVLLLFNPVYPLGAPAPTRSTFENEPSSIPRSLTYTQISKLTNLPEEELKRALQSLASGPIPSRVLRKHPQGKNVDPTDVFTLNEHLKNDRLRIRINQIQLKETVEEQKQTEHQVFLERELIIQAAAVRILKAQKQLSHNFLLEEVIKVISSRFTVDVTEIKRAFEALIEKDYMERVEGRRNMYRYIA